MSVEAAIVSMLEDDSVVVLLGVGNVWPNVVPQGETLPAVAYSEIVGSDTGYTNSGTTGLTVARFQLTIQDQGVRSYDSVCDIRDAIITLVRATRNTTYASTLIDHIESTSLDLPNLEPETTIYGKIIDMTIYVKES